MVQNRSEWRGRYMACLQDSSSLKATRKQPENYKMCTAGTQICWSVIYLLLLVLVLLLISSPSPSV